MLRLIKKHPHMLLFGVLQIFFSAPGQTFLIALFVSHIFNDIGVSQSYFAGTYSIATLMAAALLNPAGRLIDKYQMHHIIIATALLMAVGCWVLAVARSVPILFVGFFLLRLIGQGMFGLTASTLMVKKFEKNRGKALGLVILGFPLSEAVYPFIVLFLLKIVGWRYSYLILGLSNILLMLPAQLYLLKKSKIKKGEFLPGETGINPQRLRGYPEERKVRPHKDFTTGEVVRDVKFYLLTTASCLPPMVVTGLFFHQAILFNSHGWPITSIAGGIMIYAVCKAFGSVWIGGIVDRFGPLLPFASLIILLGIATHLAALGGPPVIIFMYYSLLGVTLGFSGPVTNVIWPHFYGVKHIGSIKGLVSTFRNGVTAFGPLPIAVAMDMGLSMPTILFWLAGAIYILALLPFVVWRIDR